MLKGFMPIGDIPNEKEEPIKVTVSFGKQNCISLNSAGAKFFMDSGYSRILLMISKDLKTLAFVPTKTGGTILYKSKGASFGATSVTDRIRGKHPTEDRVYFDGTIKDDCILVNIA